MKIVAISFDSKVLPLQDLSRPIDVLRSVSTVDTLSLYQIKPHTAGSQITPKLLEIKQVVEIFTTFK